MPFFSGARLVTAVWYPPRRRWVAQRPPAHDPFGCADLPAPLQDSPGLERQGGSDHQQNTPDGRQDDSGLGDVADGAEAVAIKPLGGGVDGNDLVDSETGDPGRHQPGEPRHQHGAPDETDDAEDNGDDAGSGQVLNSVSSKPCSTCTSVSPPSSRVLMTHGETTAIQNNVPTAMRAIRARGGRVVSDIRLALLHRSRRCRSTAAILVDVGLDPIPGGQNLKPAGQWSHDPLEGPV